MEACDQGSEGCEAVQVRGGARAGRLDPACRSHHPRRAAQAASASALASQAVAKALEAQRAAELRDRQARESIEKAVEAQTAAEKLYQTLEQEESTLRRNAGEEVRQAREEALAEISKSMEAETSIRAKAEAEVRWAREELAVERQQASAEVQAVLAKVEQAQRLVGGISFSQNVAESPAQQSLPQQPRQTLLKEESSPYAWEDALQDKPAELRPVQ